MIRFDFSTIQLLITSTSTAIQLTSAFIDHTRNTNRSINTTLIVTNSSVTALPQQHDSTVVGHALSPSRARSAVLREVTENSKTKRYVEIWNRNALEAMIDVSNTHGAFYTDGEFTSFY